MTAIKPLGRRMPAQAKNALSPRPHPEVSKKTNKTSECRVATPHLGDALLCRESGARKVQPVCAQGGHKARTQQDFTPGAPRPGRGAKKSSEAIQIGNARGDKAGGSHPERVSYVSLRSRYWHALRADFKTIMLLYAMSPRRIAWARLRKDQVDLSMGHVSLRGRDRQHYVAVLTPAELKAIWDEWEKSDLEVVFTYEIQRGPRRGKRAAISAGALTSAHRMACIKAGLVPMSLSDFRRQF